jgi:membrane fusion protein (multidrug efflux system)
VFVPASAVRTEAGVSKLFVLKDGRAEQRFVQIGRETGGDVEILRGLRAGERVATGGLERLADGVPIAERDP